MAKLNDTRFRKGQSGNPVGRPKSKPAAPSAFDIVLNRLLVIAQGNKTREMTVEEALQHKTYQQAIAGSRMAQRVLLKMIAKRENALAAKAPPARPIERLVEHEDPKNAYEALCLLGIATHDPSWQEQHREIRLLLEPWAVQVALNRPGLRRLSEWHVSEIRRGTLRSEALIWPKRFMP